MEFNINKDEFVKGLFRVQNIVEKKVTMPILLNVLLDAQGKDLSITATNLEVGLKGVHPAEIIKDGKATLSAKKLYEVIKELPEKKISLKLKENQWVEIFSGKSLFNIMGLSADSFPSLPVFEEDDFIGADLVVFKEMIEKTFFAVSSDETRQNLTGVFFLQKREGEEKTLKMVATDGYRLSMIDRPLNTEVKGLEKGILLPKRGLAELSKLLDEGGEKIWIKLKNNNFIVKKEGVVLIMRLLDSEFPDYRQVIPLKTKKHIRIKRTQFMESLKRVSILSSEKTKGVKFHFSKDTLELTAYNPDLGEAKEEITVEYKGEDLTVGFNARFILENLNILNSDDVLLDLEDGISPSIIRPDNDEKHTCVVMPMRI
ncbi:MAG: DNA polymerase III subunit beta [Deltaproteobacteria bacterium]|nr:DNA polymerase III subunit beta [Deltaproteobacteria bacterium]